MGLLDEIRSGYNYVNDHLGATMNSPLFTLGMGMLNGGTGLNNVGNGIMQAQQTQAQTQGLQLQNAMQRMMMGPYLQALQGGGSEDAAMQGLLGGAPQGAPQSTAAGPPLPPSQPGAIPNGATPAQTQPLPPQGPAPQAQSQPDPFAIMRQAIPMMGSPIPFVAARGKAYYDYAQQLLQRSPGFLTQQEAAKSQLTTDQYLVQQAQNSGDPTALKAAQMKLLTDSKLVNIANNNGAVTTFGNIDAGQLGYGGVNPAQGIQISGGVETPIPGAPQAQAAVAGTRARAEAIGEAAGKTIKLTAPPGSPYAGMEYEVPLDQFLQSQRGGAAPPGTPAGSGAGNVAALPPQAHSALATRGTQAADYVTTLQKSADDATTANYALDNVIAASRGASLGPGAPSREFVEKQFSALGQSLLGDKFQPPKELANYQELDKYGNQLGFATARTMGSREAAQIVNMAIQSNPNKSLTPQAFGWIANSMKAMNNYIIAKNSAIQGAERAAPGTAQQAASTWNSNINPQVWDLALDPGMAAQLAPKIGAGKISATLPVMSSADAVATFRNLPASLRPQVLAKLPLQAKQEILAGLQGQ